MYVDSIQFGDAVYTDPERVRAIIEYMTDCLTRMSGRARRKARDPLAILEIGAGLAWMCRTAKRLNPMSNTVAQDISPEATTRCAWVDRYVQVDVFCSGARRARALRRRFAHARHRASGRPCASDTPLRRPASARRHRFRHRAASACRVERALARHRRVGGVLLQSCPGAYAILLERSMEALAKQTGSVLDYWSDAHEQGQAFEPGCDRRVGARRAWRWSRPLRQLARRARERSRWR